MMRSVEDGAGCCRRAVWSCAAKLNYDDRDLENSEKSNRILDELGWLDSYLPEISKIGNRSNMRCLTLPWSTYLTMQDEPDVQNLDQG